MDQNTRDNKDRNIDWSRFGLGSETAQRVRANTSGFVDLSNDYGAGGHQASGANELFAEEQGDVPWWKSNFFISQPVLFGTWDGVFTSCLINIFGVIVFLRSGWIVGQAGVISAVLIVLATVFIALISVLSAVGICERCRIESGGVYFVIAHVLGSRFGGSLGLLYCFGQAVGCALNVLGFGESIAELIGFGEYKIAVRIIASAAVLFLSVINVAGVKWVIKLQFILLLILLLAGLDFMVGSFVHTDVENGFDGWLGGNLHANLWSEYKDGYSWFTVFGVFFPTITGILSGINMSGDLKAPSTNIPNGSLAAISTGTFLYLVFVVFLGATCHRNVLLTDFMIAAKVSAIRVLLLAGLYVSSMSSCLGAMYGTPRVLQSIALENVIPGISILGMGRGPNKVPLYSMAVVAIVTLTFIMIGEINTLAPIVTMPYLLTYACIDYSYFALAQTFDIQHQREQRFDRPKIHQTFSVDSADNDLDRLFPERTRHKTLRGESNSGSPSSPDDTIETTPIAPKTHIHSKPKNWYSNLCNRWFSLFGAALKIVIMFLVNWVYAIACISVVFLVWLYIGTANPAVKPGLASEFRFFRWLKTAILRCMGKRVYDYEQIVVTPVHPGLDVTSSQLNEDNEDFSNRRRYHQSATVHGHMVAIDD
ncbi:solute carrier family 12 member 8 [Tribolium castaneum]|uniref:Solute carrier family 12 member 8 n=1 Tax=Tribolium castaneum TaxID=7070 RepID=D6W8B2_TRICA|nr:PREDICTED: solute carrier family 12 member 8 [Tribolium castaneum]EFA10925.1 Solute carrier family 12 member 8-like Protein [Tribolium castaneum]|eukprot:XP_001809969.1 PREDICTED: solute carrier family 12 member 8 [Tribolium castaneum]